MDQEPVLDADVPGGMPWVDPDWALEEWGPEPEVPWNMLVAAEMPTSDDEPFAGSVVVLWSWQPVNSRRVDSGNQVRGDGFMAGSLRVKTVRAYA